MSIEYNALTTYVKVNCLVLAPRRLYVDSSLRPYKIGLNVVYDVIRVHSKNTPVVVLGEWLTSHDSQHL